MGVCKSMDTPGMFGDKAVEQVEGIKIIVNKFQS